MRAERVFDGLRIDVVAAADDQVFRAAGEVEPTLIVEPAQIAGREPAVAGKGLGRVGRVEESREEIRRLEQHHAVLAGRHVAVAGAAMLVERHDTHLRVRQPKADAAGGTPDVRRRDGRDAGHFGHAETFVHMQSEEPLEARRQLGRKHRGAGAAVANRRKIGTVQRNVGQCGQHRRNGRQRRWPVLFDQPPVVGQHRLVAHQRGGRNDDFDTCRQRRQRGREHARHMKKRIAVDGDVVVRAAHQLDARPRSEHLRAVAVSRQLGCTGSAPGMKVGGDVFGCDVALAHQPIVALLRAQRFEITDTFRQIGHRIGRLVVRCHAQHHRQRRHLAAQPHRLRPHARFVVRAIGDQHLGTGRLHQRHQLFVGEQRVQRLHDAGRFAAPQRKVVFEATGQQHGDRILRTDAQRVQQVGRLVDAAQQLGVGPPNRFVFRVAGTQKGQRRALAVNARHVAEKLVGTSNGECLF